MQGIFHGRVALVTGAASGIGRAIALHLAKKGASVSAVDANFDGAKSVAREIESMGSKVQAILCDVSDEQQVERAVKETRECVGDVDILINCAGGFSGGSPVESMATGEWENLFRVHCTGMFLFSRAVVALMNEGDRIINISSIDGIQGQVNGCHYAAAKGAVIAFTKTVALEVAHRGITVNAIAPGVIRTPLTQILLDVAPGLEKEIPALRYGEPEDVAEVASFLASPGAGYITGQVIVVDGGITLANPLHRTTAKLRGLP